MQGFDQKSDTARLPLVLMILLGMIVAPPALWADPGSDNSAAETKTDEFSTLLKQYETAWKNCDPEKPLAKDWLHAVKCAVDVILSDPKNPLLAQPTPEKAIPPLQALGITGFYLGKYTDMTHVEFYQGVAAELDRILQGNLPKDVEMAAQFNRYFLTHRQYARETLRGEGSSDIILDDLIALADTFYKKYPNDTRYGPTLLHWPVSRSSNFEDVGKVYTLLQERYPETPHAKSLGGTYRVLKMISEGKPLEMKFVDLVSEKPVSLSGDYRGKVVLVDFWATWCGPCVGKMKYIKADLEKYGDEGLVAIGVNVDEPMPGSPESESPDAENPVRQKVLDFLAENDYDWPQYLVGEHAMQNMTETYGVAGYPTVFLLDRQGRIRWMGTFKSDLLDTAGKVVKKQIEETEAVKILLSEEYSPRPSRTVDPSS